MPTVGLAIPVDWMDSEEPRSGLERTIPGGTGQVAGSGRSVTEPSTWLAAGGPRSLRRGKKAEDQEGPGPDSRPRTQGRFGGQGRTEDRFAHRAAKKPVAAEPRRLGKEQRPRGHWGKGRRDQEDGAGVVGVRLGELFGL
jgi:hypothetical protein